MFIYGIGFIVDVSQHGPYGSHNARRHHHAAHHVGYRVTVSHNRYGYDEGQRDRDLLQEHHDGTLREWIPNPKEGKGEGGRGRGRRVWLEEMDALIEGELGKRVR